MAFNLRSSAPACGCAACLTARWAEQQTDGASAWADPAAAPPPGLSASQIGSGLLATNAYWRPNQLTFSIPHAGATWAGYGAGDEQETFVALTSAQATQFRLAIARWDALIAPSFVETNDQTSPGNIRVGFTDHADIQDAWGYAFYPPTGGGSGSVFAGDIWINGDFAGESFAEIGYDFTALLHEIGHAIGLKHSFESPVIPSAYDDRRYTVMSYTDMPDLYWTRVLPNGGGVRSDYEPVYASTPMVLDIAAVQSRYGADPTTAAADTVYSFSESTPFLFAIYDAGGSDTFNLSSLTRGSKVDLRPGAYSSIGYFSVADQNAAALAQFPGYGAFIDQVFDGETYTWSDNVGIAFSTTIENVVGGGGADEIIGNAVANRITGGGGADALTGGAGNDVFIFTALSQISGSGDSITDFAAGDQLDFSIIAGLTFIGQSSFGNVAGQVNFTFSGGATLLRVDANGDGTADGTVRLTNGQFILAETASGSQVYVIAAAPPGDTVAPLLSSSSPADNASGVTTGANIVLTFNEAVQAGSGAIEIRRTSDGGVFRSISITDATQVTISGAVVTLNPAVDLQAGTGYYLTLASGVIRDLAGNAFAGIAGATALNFSTAAQPDTTAPLLASSTPADNTTGVPVGANIVLTFTEAVQAGSGVIEIRRAADGSLYRSISVADAGQVSISGATLTLNPASDLQAGAQYYVAIGAGVVRDLAGNAFAGLATPTALNFATQPAPNAAPTLVSSTPADGAGTVSPTADLVLTFSEAVQRGSGAVEIRRSADGALVQSISVADAARVSISGAVVTVVLADLALDTSYYLLIPTGAFADAAGLAFAGLASPTALDFTTAPFASVLPGGPGGDALDGSAQPDLIQGLAGDDTLNGLGGNDELDGGQGVDKALYAGWAKDYAWWQADDGAWRVQDLRPGSPEGTDTLTFIEQLVFADSVVKIGGATNAEALAQAFAQVMRIIAPTGADQTFLNGLIAAVDGGSKSLEAAYGEIVQRADGSTAVAAMTYQFFLGFAPSKGGFDYLVSPAGPNPNNINSAYYQSFSTENRYINFAVNVGSVGDGKAAFSADYGALSLRQATAKAYQEIFGGAAPGDAFLSLLLDSPVEGGMTRKDYFAAYGGDGLDGLGTKAAMVGWLLTEAAKADVGTLVRASNAYLADLADGAEFRVDMVGVYSQPDWAHNPPG